MSEVRLALYGSQNFRGSSCTSCVRQAQAAGRLRQRDSSGRGYAAVAELVEAADARNAYCLFRRANRYLLCDSPTRSAAGRRGELKMKVV
jgi:hypothetical protein